MVDPIVELGQLAVEFGIGLHVDCCLGGFVLPWLKRLGFSIANFDFSVPAVTSMSVDTHKVRSYICMRSIQHAFLQYGQSPKGSSVVLYRTRKLRRYMYFATTEWPGGLYASPTLSGSRPGAGIAAPWASLVSIGEAGFKRQAAAIADGVKKLKSGCAELFRFLPAPLTTCDLGPQYFQHPGALRPRQS